MNSLQFYFSHPTSFVSACPIRSEKHALFSIEGRIRSVRLFHNEQFVFFFKELQEIMTN